MSSLRLIDGLTGQEVYSVLREILPNEKSDKRRMSRLENFVSERAIEDRDWVSQYAASLGREMTEEELEEYEKRAYCISHAILLQFEIAIRNKKYWAQHVENPENRELRKMEAFPGRFSPRYPQNNNSRWSSKAIAPLLEFVTEQKGGSDSHQRTRDLYNDVGFILNWHPEMKDGDILVEVKAQGDSPEDFDLVVRMANGEIFGQPTKTLEQIAAETMVSRTKTRGASGRLLDITDPFLGILKPPASPNA